MFLFVCLFEGPSSGQTVLYSKVYIVHLCVCVRVCHTIHSITVYVYELGMNAIKATGKSNSLVLRVFPVAEGSACTGVL